MRVDLYVHHVHPHPHHHLGRTDICVVGVGQFQELPMPPQTDHAPDFNLASSDDYAVLAIVGAKLPDGSYVPSGAGSWTSSAPDHLVVLPDGIQTQADPAWVDPGDGSVAPQVPVLDAAGNQIPIFYVQSNTPGDNGNDLVTWSAPNMASCDIHVIWKTPPVGHVMIQPSEKPEV